MVKAMPKVFYDYQGQDVQAKIVFVRDRNRSKFKDCGSAVQGEIDEWLVASGEWRVVRGFEQKTANYVLYISFCS